LKQRQGKKAWLSLASTSELFSGLEYAAHYNENVSFICALLSIMIIVQQKICNICGVVNCCFNIPKCILNASIP
jgi:hypothetical protein